MMRYYEQLERRMIEMGMPRKELSERSKISATMLSQYFRGLKSLTIPRFRDLCAALDIDIDAFIGGGGVIEAVEEAIPGVERLPIFGNVQAGANGDWGDTVQIVEGQAIEGYNVPESLVLRRRAGSRVGCVRVRGDSMEPFLLEGDVVLVEVCADWGAVRKGDTVVVDTTGQGEYVIKRLTLFGEDLRNRWLVSHNGQYDPVIVRRWMRLFGLVVGVYRPMI